jgi:hypothetical protein
MKSTLAHLIIVITLCGFSLAAAVPGTLAQLQKLTVRDAAPEPEPAAVALTEPVTPATLEPQFCYGQGGKYSLMIYITHVKRRADEHQRQRSAIRICHGSAVRA